MTAGRAVRFPVSLVMARQQVRHRQWTYPRWTAVGCVAGAAAGNAPGGGNRGIQRRKIRDDADGTEQFVWSGLHVELHRDAAESYWHNLVGRQPSLFVVCRSDGDGEMRPCAVSADYDEAGAYMEADDAVFSVPMPPEIYRWLETFVLDNYRPTPPKKRQRTAWAGGESNGGRR